jgi:hypothetical protein
MAFVSRVNFDLKRVWARKVGALQSQVHLIDVCGLCDK